MVTSGIKVVHGGVDQAGADMNATVKQIDDRMNRLESELEPLRSQWSGNQQDAYYRAKAKWDQAIAEMRDLLARSAVSVDEANQNYRAADMRGAQTFE